MKYEIKNWYTGTTIISDEAESFSALVQAAVKSGANLDGANLTRANLDGANLDGANLDGANLTLANLYGANLTRANLYGANLTRAILYGANLYGANLTRAILYGANLDGANLDGAILYGANLDGANLYGAENISDLANAQLSIVPETGAFIGWKKCQNNVIVQLQIPADAERSNATGRKCRASKVKVLKVFGAKEGISRNDESVVYKTGRIVKPTAKDPWNPNRWIECAGGIHFFITRLEAEKY
jgi:hypothetical protein